MIRSPFKASTERETVKPYLDVYPNTRMLDITLKFKWGVVIYLLDPKQILIDKK